MKTKAPSETLSDEQFHAIARALADPRRFAIFQQIAAVDSIPCSNLNEHEVISPATISHHMKELHDAGLIEMKREGRGANLSPCRSVFEAYIARLVSLQHPK
jgi:ArsR family transcriptional regulator, arsenate/arsenite/antimonite-responsive transcriptional repressor